MFSNVGWGEILLIFVFGLILVGPERLPKVIADVRAMILAARTAINDARENLNNEFGDDFDELRKPLQDLGELRKLNPKTAITRTLFDGDDTYLDLLSGKPAAGGGKTAGEVAAGAVGGAAAPANQAGQQAASAAPAQSEPQQWVDPVAQARAAAATPTPGAQPVGGQPQATQQVNNGGAHGSAGEQKTSPSPMNWADDDVL